MNADLRYFLTLCGALLTAALPCIALNYRIGDVSWANANIARAAHVWQTAERENIVAIAPPQERNFKFLMVTDRLARIDAVVLGSSTSLSITSTHLAPLGANIYNYATRANPAWRMVAEAEYFTDNAPTVKWLVVSLDGANLKEDVPPPAVVMKVDALSVPRRLEDTLTLPRIIALGSTVADWVQASDPIAAVSTTLNPVPSAPYSCHGTIARNFALPQDAHCNGFRWDGSLDFGGLSRMSEDQYWMKLRFFADSQYFRTVVSGQGFPNELYLRHLARLAAILRARGGGMIALLPPMLPGLEQELMRNEVAKRNVRRTKTMLDEWARETDIVVIDAIASERVHCEYNEFVDEVHPFSTCYDKIFASFWRDRPHSGLYIATTDASPPAPAPISTRPPRSQSGTDTPIEERPPG